MKIIFLFLYLLIFNPVFFSQQENPDANKIVAQAGNDKITAEEFKYRFDFSPHPRKSESLDTSLVKREYLYTLIAEKLLAQKAKSLNLDTAKDIRDILKYMEKLFVRDEYFKLEISNKIKITPEEIKEAEIRSTKLLVVKYLYSEDENEINNLYSKLKKGASIDSLLIDRPEYKEQLTSRTVSFGTLDKSLEDSLYNLKPGEFTTPLKTAQRWYIFKLIKIIKDPSFTNEDTRFKIEKKIKDRKTERLADEFLFNFLHKQKVEVDKEIFFKILGMIKNIVKERLSEGHESMPLILGASDFDKIINLLGKETIREPFIKFEHNPEPVEEFLTQSKFITFKVDSVVLRNIDYAFNDYVKDYIQNELLVRAAYKKGIQNYTSVKKDMKVWEDYYLAQGLEKKIYDSIHVSANEAYEFYTRNNDSTSNSDEVHIKEILTDNLDKIEAALNEINKGLSFEDAVKKYSINNSLKAKGGDLGYFRTTSFGEIGKIAGEMKVGEIYGPIKVQDDYALIKLIEKRKSSKPIDTSFTNIKDDMIEFVKGIKLRGKLKKYVAGLASEYGIKINAGIFKSVPVLQFNTVTVRMIGFGGRIYAFPYQPLFSDWYDLYKSEMGKMLQ
jgi:parvulin-like peptidyl-prolyl isomerase